MLAKNKLCKRKFVYFYWDVLHHLQEITNSHYFQTKKWSQFYDCDDLVHRMCQPYKMTFLKSVNDLKEYKFKKHDPNMVCFTLFIQNQVVMIGILPLKKEVHLFAAIDFEDLDNLDNLKHTLNEYIYDKEMKNMIDNEMII